MYTIYALVDPRDKCTRYVGLTENVYERFKEHMRGEGRNHEKDAWIQEMQTEQVLMIMESLEKSETLEEAREREYHWIRHYLDSGASLFNIQQGQTQALLKCQLAQAKASAPPTPPVKKLEPHITYQYQYRRCGKEQCTSCKGEKGHGPYWYAYWREGKKLRSAYIGKIVDDSSLQAQPS